MSLVTEALQHIQIGAKLSHEGLTVHPLIRESLLNKDYLTLDEALELNTAQVTEVSDSGSVPELLFRNLGDKAVFLLDGEEVVGAKQNRILNISILAPAEKDTTIPVSCVEAGRWHHDRSDFTSAPRNPTLLQAAPRRLHGSAKTWRHLAGRTPTRERYWSDNPGKNG